MKKKKNYWIALMRQDGKKKSVEKKGGGQPASRTHVERGKKKEKAPCLSSVRAHLQRRGALIRLAFGGEKVEERHRSISIFAWTVLEEEESP